MGLLEGKYLLFLISLSKCTAPQAQSLSCLEDFFINPLKDFVWITFAGSWGVKNGPRQLISNYRGMFHYRAPGTMDVISPEIITLPPLSLCFIKIKCDIVIQFRAHTTSSSQTGCKYSSTVWNSFNSLKYFPHPTDMKYFSWWDIILSRAAQAAADRHYLGGAI